MRQMAFNFMCIIDQTLDDTRRCMAAAEAPAKQNINDVILFWRDSFCGHREHLQFYIWEKKKHIKGQNNWCKLITWNTTKFLVLKH